MAAKRLLMLIAPVGVLLIGWLWQYVGYRMAFHSLQAPIGFYRLPGGHRLQWLLFGGPTLAVLVSLAALAIVVGRALSRQGRHFGVVFYFAMCVVSAIVFAAPGIWFIDIPGAGGLVI